MITVARNAGSALPQRTDRTPGRPSPSLPALRVQISLPPAVAPAAPPAPRKYTWARASDLTAKAERAVAVSAALPVGTPTSDIALKTSDEREWAEALRVAKARAVADDEERAWQLTVAQTKARLQAEEELEWAAQIARARALPTTQAAVQRPKARAAAPFRRSLGRASEELMRAVRRASVDAVPWALDRGNDATPWARERRN